MSALGAGPVRAQSASPEDDDREAREHFMAGQAHFEAARYALALEEFRAAYDRMEGHPNRPVMLYNIGRSAEELGQLEEAASYYRRFLDEANAEAGNRAEARERLRNLDATLRASRPGREPEAPAAASADLAPRPVDQSSPADPVPAIIGFAVAGAGLVMGGVFGGLALAEDDRVSGLPCAETQTCPDAEVSDLGTFGLLTDVGFGVAAAGAIVGTVLLLTLGLDRGSSAEHAWVAPWFSDDGVGLGAGASL